MLSLPVGRRMPLPTPPIVAKANTAPPPAVSEPAKKPASNPPVRSEEKTVSRTSQTQRPPVTIPSAAARATVDRAPLAADNLDAAPAVRQTARPMPALLKDPVPRVTAILVSADRKLATVGDDGQIIGIGDVLGRRTVVGIDERAVVLKEPSGVHLRVALGGRVIGVERGER